MKNFVLFLFLVPIVGVLLPVTMADPLETCVPRNSSYNIGDSKQCDKYWVCSKAGKMLDRLCDDGFVYSLDISQCAYPHEVDCAERPLMQPTKSTHPNCPRSNGFYPYPASVSCQHFYHCLEGVAYEKSCPAGVIFDPAHGTCTHPDMSKRTNCSASVVLDFVCPNSLNRFTKLKFGDHDRHAHPGDCKMFFICLKSGKPRVGGCPGGMVFNGKTGYCDVPKVVKGCENYYGSQDVDVLRKQSESENFDFDGDFDNEVEIKVPQLPSKLGTSSSSTPDTPTDEEGTIQARPQPIAKPKKTFTKAKRHAPGFRHNQEGQGRGGFGQGGLGHGQQFGPQQQQFGQQPFGHQQQFGPQQFGPGQNFERRYRETKEEEDDDDEDKDDDKVSKSRVEQIKREVKGEEPVSKHEDSDSDDD